MPVVDAMHRIEPFYFGASGRELLGCYHAPAVSRDAPVAPGPVRDAGLVLCYPLGHEYLQFHRVFRQLAILLSDAGFPVLRFDFHGCGDSAGDDGGWRLERWAEDVQTSIEELKRRAGVATIGLFGLRLGAALAARVGASRGDVDALVLWDPVLNGKAYLEELRRLHRGMLSYAHVRPDPRPASERGEATEEILGFPLPAPLIADLEDLDLLAIEARPARRALVIESNDAVDQTPLRDLLGRLGTSVEHRRFSNPHLWVWLEDFAKVHVPHQILQAVVSWAREAEA